eukprot:gene10117-15552_t
MAISGLNWLGEKIGVDITGSKSEGRRGDGLFDRMGQALFSAQKEEKAEIPKDKWQYVYNEEKKIWEPGPGAPESVLKQHREKLANPTDAFGKPLTKQEVAPPPPPPGPANWNTSVQSSAKYVDVFGGATSSQPGPVVPSHAGGAQPSARYPQAGSAASAPSLPQDAVLLKAPAAGYSGYQQQQQQQQPTQQYASEASQ